jgi:hypothetical protein
MLKISLKRFHGLGLPVSTGGLKSYKSGPKRLRQQSCHYDSLAGLDHLQYPHTEAFGMPSIHRTYLIPGLHPSRCPHSIYPSASHHLGFPTLYLAAPMAEYTYRTSYTNSSPGCPYTHPYTCCLDVLERRRDVVRQHLWLHQSRLWFPLS